MAGKPELLEEGVKRVLSAVWRGWLKLAAILGNIQMAVLLTIIYWTILALVAIPFKLLSDPLALRRSRNFGWLQRRKPEDYPQWMRKQG